MCRFRSDTETSRFLFGEVKISHFCSIWNLIFVQKLAKNSCFHIKNSGHKIMTLIQVGAERLEPRRCWVLFHLSFFPFSFSFSFPLALPLPFFILFLFLFFATGWASSLRSAALGGFIQKIPLIPKKKSSLYSLQKSPNFL